MDRQRKMRVKYGGGPQIFLRAAVNTNEKRNHETDFTNMRGPRGGSCQRTLNSSSP